MAETPRRPAAFRIDDPGVVVARAGTPPPEAAAVAVTPVDDDSLVENLEPPARKRRWSWSTLFWTGVGGLVSLALGLAVDRLIRELFERADWLGWVGLVFLALAVLALLVMVAREAAGLMRLATIDRLRADAVAAAAANDDAASRTAATAVAALYAARPDLAAARRAVSAHLDEVIDGRDVIALAERELLAGLDLEARRLVLGAAKRVSIVTAVSPRAVVDVAMVAFEAVRLIRRLAILYGGRPGSLGLIRLARNVFAHLAVTGGMAVGDSLVQQIVGHGIAARLSARLGEGVINGLLTARVGLAAIDVCRPLPFIGLPPPSIRDIMGEIMRRDGG